jgi:hypothetical protein
MSKTPFRKHPSLFAPLVLLAVTASSARIARAQAGDDDPVAQITQLNRDALAAYQAHKYEDARKLLKQALDVAAAASLDQHPIKARTHIHMGVVIINGFKQREVGIKQFKKAIEIQPDIMLTKNLVTPDLQAAFDQAVAEMKSPPPEGGEGKVTPPEPPQPPPSPSGPEASGGLVHEAVTQGKQGSAISISVGVQSDLKFDKLVLAYRPDGGSDFLGRQMKEVSEGTYAAEIPTSATGGRSVSYYIEAEDKEGSPVASRGSADSPLTITLKGSARPAVAARKPDDEDEGEDEDEEDEGTRSKLYFGLLGGTGGGYATGNGETNANVMIKPPGMAWSVLQFAPEIGYWLRPNLMLSVQGRFQYIFGTTDLLKPDPRTGNERVYHTANYAVAGFVKATWRFGEGTYRPFFSLAAGGGDIRHVVTFKTLKECGVQTQGGVMTSKMQPCTDTISAGPLAFGPGGGIMANVADHVAVVLQINTQLAFPDFTFNGDLDLGAAVQF